MGCDFPLVAHSLSAFPNWCISSGSEMIMSQVQGWHSRLWNMWVTVLPGSMAKPLLTHLVNTQRSLSQVFLSCPNVPLCLLFLIASSSCSGEISYSNNSYNYLISLTSSLKILVKGLDTTTHSNWCFFWQSSGKVIPQNLSKIHRSQAPSVAIIFLTVVKYFNHLEAAAVDGLDRFMQLPLELWGRAAQMYPLHEQSPTALCLVWVLLSWASLHAL